MGRTQRDQLAAVFTVLLQVLYLTCFGQGGGKAADVGLDLRGDGVAEEREGEPHRRLGRMSKLNETVHPALFGLNS